MKFPPLVQKSLVFDDEDRDRRAANPTRWEATKASTPLVNGPGFVPELDEKRLNSQAGRIFELMKDGRWRTLAEITERCKPGGEASMSAQLRSLRKKGHTVNRKRTGNPKSGLFSYQLVVKGK
jgi:hypothetical protein